VRFAIVGGSAMHLQDEKALGEAATAQGRLFDVLQQYPIATVSSIVVMILVAVFFVSGVDAASIVMGTPSQPGCPEPTWAVVGFWGVLTGAVAAVMLLVGGGGGDAFTGLQNLTILAAAHPGDGRFVYRAHPRSAPRPAHHPRAEGQGGHRNGRHGRP
jgi:choline-glycine betaine transporter